MQIPIARLAFGHIGAIGAHRAALRGATGSGGKASLDKA